MKNNKKSIIKNILVIVATSLIMFGAGYFVRGFFIDEKVEVVENEKENIQIRVYDGNIQLYKDEIWCTVMTVEMAMEEDPLAVEHRQEGVYAEGAVDGLVRKQAVAPEDKEKKETTYSGNYSNTSSNEGSTINTPVTPPANNTGTVSTPTVESTPSTETTPETEATTPDTGAEGDGSSSGDGEDMWSGDIL